MLKNLLRRLQSKNEKPVKHILLLAHNELMAQYLAAAGHSLRAKDIKTFMAFVPDSPRFLPEKKIAARLRMPYLAFKDLEKFKWDLILLADHFPSGMKLPGAPRVFLGHGIEVHIVHRNGEPYRYRYAKDPAKAGLYRLIFTHSPASRDAVCREYPLLKDVVKHGGCLRVDHMLALRPARERIRRGLGLRTNDRAVLILSSWSETSLMKTNGFAFLAEALRLQRGGRYRFIVSTHPNLWRDGNFVRAMKDWKKKGLSVIVPPEPWERYLIAADAAVSDYTSLSLEFALLKKPVLYTEFQGITFWKDCSLKDVYEASPHLRSPDELGPALEKAFNEELSGPFLEAAAKIYSGDRRASDIIREEIRRLLF